MVPIYYDRLISETHGSYTIEWDLGSIWTLPKRRRDGKPLCNLNEQKKILNCAAWLYAAKCKEYLG